MTAELTSRYLNCNQSLLKNIPQGLNRVFEFGCSGGMLGKSYKEENPDCVWHGVDIFKPAIEHAKDNLDGAWVKDANHFVANKTMQKEPYDALIYGDVVEHLVAPEVSLQDHLPLLKTGGQVIVCIPNVQYWNMMKHVLSGNWNYGPSLSLIHI